jgi:hypothetical protein
MSETLNNTNVVQRLIKAVKFKSTILERAILDHLAKNKHAENLKLFVSDEWFEFRKSEKKRADELLSELCAMLP